MMSEARGGNVGAAVGVIIMGAPRSGTSMVASLFRDTHYMGEQPLRATVANPLGYFEDAEVNDLNNRIIGQLLHWPFLNRVRCRLAHRAVADRRVWAHVEPRRVRPVLLEGETRDRVAAQASRTPFCFKDPRFSVTYPTWRPYLPEDHRILIVYREPERTVESMLRNSRETYDPPTPVDAQWCLSVWIRRYRRLLATYASDSRARFVHYRDVANGSAFERIETFIRTRVERDAVDLSVRRTADPDAAGRDPAAADVYRRLEDVAKGWCMSASRESAVA